MSGILLKIIKKILGDNYILVKKHNIQSLTGWFFSVLSRQYAVSKSDNSLPFGTFYEFGTGAGNNLIQFLSTLRIFCKKNNLQMSDHQIFLFDTFTGMPKATIKEDIRRGLTEGVHGFSIEELKQNLNDAGFNPDELNIRYIKGNFSDSLTPELRDELKKHPPAIIDLDVGGPYSATKTVLDWVTPICASGVMFYFDDYFSFHGNPEYGQIKAINEFNENKETGYLTPFQLYGKPGNSWIYSKKIFEYT